MSDYSFTLRGLTFMAGLLIGCTASRAQDQMPSEHKHGQQQSEKSTQPEQQHSQHDMSKMAGMEQSSMDHSEMNSSGCVFRSAEYTFRASVNNGSGAAE